MSAAEIVNMALAEIGYGSPVVPLRNGGIYLAPGVPPEVVWKAAVVTRTARRCWACYQRDGFDIRRDCDITCTDPFSEDCGATP